MPLSSLQIKNWKLFWYEQPLIRSGRHVWGYIYMHISQVSCIYSRNMIKTMAWEHKRMTPTHTIYWIYRHLYLLSFNRKWNECRLHICYPLELSWTKKMLDLSLLSPYPILLIIQACERKYLGRESMVLDFVVSF